MSEPVITIQDAFYLMEILNDDIPSYEKKRIAFLLLLLVANPELVENKTLVFSYGNRYCDYDDIWAREYGY